MSDRPGNAGSEPVGKPTGDTTGTPATTGSGAGPGDNPDASSGGSSGASSSARSWVVPALLFVAGLLLGGVAVAAANLGNDDADPVATPVESPSPTPSPSRSAADGPQDVMVRIPAPCVQVAEEADAAFEDVDAFAQAVRDFDARRLQEFLDRFQEVRPRIEGLAEQCRTLASEGIVDGDLITPTPAASS